MEKKNKETLVITSVICLLPIILGVVFYAQLPEEIAIHFDNAGEANGFVSKFFGIFMLPVLMCVVNALVQIRLENDPRKAAYSQTLKSIIKWVVPLSCFVLMVFTIFINMGKDISIEWIAPIFIGILFIVIGNYLPKCKMNYSMGIRCPWTLHSVDNWNKTHRFAGYIWIIAGVLMCAGTLFDFTLVPITIIVVIIIMLAPFLYSFVLYKRS